MLTKAADVLTDEITVLFGKAVKYHTSQRDTEAEQILKMTLQDLSSRISILAEVSPELDGIRQCRTGILGLKQSITGYHFEDEHTAPIGEGCDQIQCIAADALRLKQNFQRYKQRQFL